MVQKLAAAGRKKLDALKVAAKAADKVAEVGGGGRFDEAGKMARNGSRKVLSQGNAPTCGPTSCGMVMDTLGLPVDLPKFIRQADVGPDGTEMSKLTKVLRDNGTDASTPVRVSLLEVMEATAKGNPAILAVKQGGGGHAIVVDGITGRDRTFVVAIRDPWGKQYFERLDVFKERYLGWAILVKGTKK
jgi:filamentous hemagglutinin